MAFRTSSNPGSWRPRRRSIARVLVAALGLGVVVPATSAALGQAVAQVQAREIVVEGPGQPIEDLNYQPGFILPLADEEVHKQVNTMLGHLDAGAWGEAFRLMTELGDTGLDAMVPVGDKGLHKAVRVPLQERLLAMPPDGKRAFRLYFDAQAREMLDAVTGHPHPGSDDQLAIARQLVDRLSLSSVGPEAADLLGELYFERGAFEQAERSWREALAQGDVSGQDELRLQVKRGLALVRAGDQARAAQLHRELSQRYTDPTVVLGGRPVDAVGLLGDELEQAGPADDRGPSKAESPTLTLPAQDTLPSWHLQFLNPTDWSRVSMSSSRNSYVPADLAGHVPPVTADDERVYFHWLGVVFALDRQSGRILWMKGSIEQTAMRIQQFINSNAGDPRNYQIAVGKRALLINGAQATDSGQRCYLAAYDKANGELLWTSIALRGWALQGSGGDRVASSTLGEPLIDGRFGYVVTHKPGEMDCFLVRFAVDSGEVDWTLPIGSGDPITFMYTDDIRRMPQPKLLLNDTLLHVLTNNACLVTVDLSAGEVAWAVRMVPPMGVGASNNEMQFRSSRSQVEQTVNINSTGGMILRGGVLYAKEADSKALYALDPRTGEQAWVADKLPPDAHLFGVDDQRFYLMNGVLSGYEMTGDHNLDWDNRNNTGNPNHAGAILAGDRIVAITTPDRLRAFDVNQRGDLVGTYESDYIGSGGGRLVRFGDLLVCITRRDITAFKLDPQPNP